MDKPPNGEFGNGFWFVSKRKRFLPSARVRPGKKTFKINIQLCEVSGTSYNIAEMSSVNAGKTFEIKLQS